MPTKIADSDQRSGKEAEKTASEIVHEQWIQFCTGSSIRGLKRTLTSQTIVLRVFWSVFLLGSLGIMTAQISAVVVVYLDQKDSTAIRTQKLPNSPEKFPAITLCRKDPFRRPDVVSEVLRHQNASFTSPEQFNLHIRRQLLKEWTRANYSDNLDNFIAADLFLATYDTSAGFIAQVPRTAIRDISIHLSDTLVYATLMFRNGTPLELVRNAPILSEFTKRNIKPGSFQSYFKIRPFYHWQYMLCQTITFDFSDSALREISSVEAVIWSPPTKFSTAPNNTFFRSYAMKGFSFGNGVLLALHDSKTRGMSAIDSSHVLLKSASLTDVQFSTISTKYYDCKSEPLLHGSEGQYAYDSRHCRSLLRDKLLRDSCNCTFDPLSWDMRHCLYLPPGRELDAADSFSDCRHNLQHIGNECNKPACNLVEYPFTSTDSPWNINDFQWKWFWEMCADDASGLEAYLLEATSSDFSRSESLKAPLFDFDKVKNNLASFKVTRRTITSTEMTEIQLTSLGNLLSSMGGALSLYMGITLTLTAEFIEFIILLVMQLQTWRAQRKKNRREIVEPSYQSQQLEQMQQHRKEQTDQQQQNMQRQNQHGLQMNQKQEQQRDMTLELQQDVKQELKQGKKCEKHQSVDKEQQQDQDEEQCNQMNGLQGRAKEHEDQYERQLYRQEKQHDADNKQHDADNKQHDANDKQHDQNEAQNHVQQWRSENVFSVVMEAAV